MRELREERSTASFGPQSRPVAGPELPAPSLYLFLPKRRGLAIFTASSLYTDTYESYSRSQDKNTAMGAFNQ